MKLLAVDIGTGTQDILLYDPRFDAENSLKLVLPSPTMIVRERIRRATRAADGIVLTGVMMGGGPCAWAAEDHIRAGYAVYATPQAALTFNDDLEAVAQSGVRLVSEDEAAQLPASIQRVELRDFDYGAIRRALLEFGLDLNQEDLGCVAVAVFDHGAAPVGVSDRQFRFDYLDQRVRAAQFFAPEVNQLSTFAFTVAHIPAIMTRLQSVAHCADEIPAPLVVMDTAPAAVLGATLDSALRAASTLQIERAIYVNIGNFHTIAFRLGPQGIEGIFEHHTGLLDQAKLEKLLRALADGSLTHAEVFDGMGHGALVYAASPFDLDGPGTRLVVTGPRRALLAHSALRPYYAVPFGDMMIAGCFGLLAAAADLLPDLREPILNGLKRSTAIGRPPWETD